MSHYRFSLSSRIGHSGQLRRWIAGLARMEGYGERFASELALSVHEAFVNAVLHGNHADPELPVVIAFETGRSRRGRSLEVRIRDFGEGFDPAPHITSAHLEAGRSKSGGRGLLLMSNFAENLAVERLLDGCVVRLHYIPY